MEICSILGCGRRVTFRGWCNAHYQRWQKWGNPHGKRKTMNGEPKKFLAIAMEYRGDNCVIWPYSKNSQGYANLQVDGKKRLVFRIICEHFNGASKIGQEAAHSCGNGHRGCIAGKHLRWATHIENEEDKKIHGTLPQGETHHSAKLTREDVINIRIMYDTMQYRQKDIGAMFGVSQATINVAINDPKHLSGKRTQIA